MEAFNNNEIQKAVEEAASDAPFTAIPVYSHCIDITANDVDVWGHANNVCYLHWMQDVAVAHSAAIGWTPDRYLEYGAIWVVRRHTIEYRQSAFRGEKLLVQTWIAEMKNVTCFRRYRFLRLPKGFESVSAVDQPRGLSTLDALEFPKSAIVATAETLWGFVSTGTPPRPTRVAPELKAAFETVVESGVKFPQF